MGVVGPDHDENRAFLSYTRTFLELGLPVPRLYAVDEAAGAWLEEDLGRTTLFDAVLAARAAGHAGACPSPSSTVYRQVLRVLPRFQVEGGRAVDYGAAYPRADFDAQAMRWDLSYFKYHFLMLAHVPFHEDRLERDFARLVAVPARERHASTSSTATSSRATSWCDEGRPAFLDYQGGRRGALQYDVASLLHDAKAGLPAPSCARSCSTSTWRRSPTHVPRRPRGISRRTTAATSCSARCRRWGPTGIGASTSASRGSSRA